MFENSSYGGYSDRKSEENIQINQIKIIFKYRNATMRYGFIFYGKSHN